MTGFLLTAKQKLMLCINKRLYSYDSGNNNYSSNDSNYSSGNNYNYDSGNSSSSSSEKHYDSWYEDENGKSYYDESTGEAWDDNGHSWNYKDLWESTN